MWRARRLRTGERARISAPRCCRSIISTTSVSQFTPPLTRAPATFPRPCFVSSTQVLLDWSQKVSASGTSRKSVNAKASTAPVTPLTSRSSPAVTQQQQQPSRRASVGVPVAGTPGGGDSLPHPPVPASSSSLSSLFPSPSSAAQSPPPPPVQVVGVPASAALPAPLAGAGGGAGGAGAAAWGAAGAAAGGGRNGGANSDNGANPGLLLPPPSSTMMPQRGPGKGGRCCDVIRVYGDKRKRLACVSVLLEECGVKGSLYEPRVSPQFCGNKPCHTSVTERRPACILDFFFLHFLTRSSLLKMERTPFN